MASIAKTYDTVSDACCVGLSGAALVFTCVSVLYDVGARASGLQPPIWTSAATEYAMLLLTMAIAPYLVRHHGHVRIEILNRTLPAVGQKLLHRGVSLMGCGVCMVIFVIAMRMGIDVHSRGELDIRSIEMPRWVLFAAIAAGFGLCAVEFLRQGLSPANDAEAHDATGGL
ncbi:TRAP transporter small permease [Aminobacter sp. AP02]|uniref:TRAP transporter small permease n=1 Tax=Aminobacter sp. AP02 TaxID=2135737 RepID=UPI000D7A6334|nr:TRAP transporter small permease [Aminobacter sp. AP02]PWK66370.1 TRAP-type C4-dicarboxylate transport system permease small subunit [Aminobacter sp. AP02]